MQHREYFTLVNHNGEQLFKNEETRKLLDLIDRTLLGIHFIDGKEYYARYEVLRGGVVFDSGEYGFINKDDTAFNSRIIFHEYWKSHGAPNQKTSDGFVPEMFQEGDVLTIEHNLPYKISDQLKMYEPTIVEYAAKYGNGGALTHDQISEYYKTAKEVFPEVYRYHPINLKENIRKIFQAVKLIEEDGIEGFHSAAKLAGNDVALALIITHLRRSMGSMKTYPAGSEGLNIEVAHFLKQAKILDF